MKMLMIIEAKYRTKFVMQQLQCRVLVHSTPFAPFLAIDQKLNYFYVKSMKLL